MYKFSFLLLSLSLLLVSCNEDDTPNPEPELVEVNFFGLKVGNSWVYNYFSVNQTTGEYTNVGATETVEIIAEEELGGAIVFTVRTTTIDEDDSCPFCNNEPIVFTKVKDSLGYLVEVDGPILFSSISDEDYQIASYAFGDIY